MSTAPTDPPTDRRTHPAAGQATDPAAEVAAFFERYMDAFNARDGAAFAACFHPPVTVLPAPGAEEAGVGRTLPILTDPASLLGQLPDYWAHSTVDALAPLGTLAPPPVDPDARSSRGPRLGVVATATRWDLDGRPYHRIQALYLLTRQDGALGIKVISELVSTLLPR